MASNLNFALILFSYLPLFCQVKAQTPLKQLMRSKAGALKDQSRLIQHFTKELQTANFRSQALWK